MRNERGFSLVEVMVAAAFVGILALGLAQVMAFNSKAARSVTLSAEWGVLVASVSQALQAPAACTAMLGGTAWDAGAPVVPLAALNLASGPIARTGFPAAGMQVTDIRITGVDQVLGVLPQTGDLYGYLVNLRVAGRKISGGGPSIGVNDYAQDFKVTLWSRGPAGQPPATATGTVERCQGQSSALESCAYMGGRFFPAGTAVCPASPDARCDLKETACAGLGGTYDYAACKCNRATQVDRYAVNAPREQVRSVTTAAGAAYEYCGLSYVRVDGNNDNKSCRITPLGGGAYQLTARCSDDPWTECEMSCTRVL